jgi:hypothetical protein
MTSSVMRRTASPTVPRAASWWLAGIVLLTLLGFQRAVTRTDHPLDVAHAVHGLSALGWSAILAGQAWLAERGRREAHRLLGMLGVVFAFGLVATSLPMMRALAAGATANVGFRPIGLRLLAMDGLLLLLFVMLFAVAIAYVRRPVVHARALAATGLLALPAGLGRVVMRVAPVDPAVASYGALGSAAPLLSALIVTDRRAGVRDAIQPVVLGAIVAIALLMGPLAESGWFAAWAGRLG